MRTSVSAGSGSPLTRDQAAQDFRLARRLMRRGQVRPAFAPEPADDLRSFDQQVLQLVVDLVEAPAQVLEIGGHRRHRFNYSQQGGY